MKEEEKQPWNTHTVQNSQRKEMHANISDNSLSTKYTNSNDERSTTESISDKLKLLKKKTDKCSENVDELNKSTVSDIKTTELAASKRDRTCSVEIRKKTKPTCDKEHEDKSQIGYKTSIYKSIKSSEALHETESRLSPSKAMPSKSSLFDTKELYLKDEELLPYSNPENEWSKSLIELKCSDWGKQFEACNTIRRLSKHHIFVITNPHSAITELLKLVESLRSGLAKNALIVIGDLFNGLKKGLDSEVDSVLRILLKKSVDSNEFISKQSEVILIMYIYSQRLPKCD